MALNFNWLFGRHNGLDRQFEPPQTINEAVAGHHRMLMVTVLGLITSLAITSTNTLTIWQHVEGLGASVCEYPPQGTYNDEINEGLNITGVEKGYLCGRGREGHCNNVLRNSNRQIWAEALPEATCVWCLFIWLITFSLLFVNNDWLQRILYYLIVVSETAAVATLLIRPFLIYLIYEFVMCLVVVFVTVSVLAAALVLVDKRWNVNNRNRLIE